CLGFRSRIQPPLRIDDKEAALVFARHVAAGRSNALEAEMQLSSFWIPDERLIRRVDHRQTIAVAERNAPCVTDAEIDISNHFAPHTVHRKRAPQVGGREKWEDREAQ